MMAVKHLTFGEFFMNITRAILFIGFAKYLYDLSGSLWYIAITFIVEQIVAFIVPLFSGLFIDKWGSRRIVVCSTGSALFVLVVSLLISVSIETSILFLLVASILFNVANTAIRLSVFTVTSEAAKNNNLSTANGMLQIAVQSGQLTGLACIAFILLYGTFDYILLMASVTTACALYFYRISVSGIKNTHKSSVSINNSFNLFNYIGTLFHKSKLFFLLVISSFDHVNIAIFNLLLAPIVKQYYDNNGMYMSILDGAYAFGAIAAGILVGKSIIKKGLNPIVVVFSQLSAVILFFVLINDTVPNLIQMLFIGVFGIATTLSVIYLNSRIQHYSPIEEKGKIAAARRIIVSVFIAILISLVSMGYEISYSISIIVSIVIALLFLLAAYYWFSLNKVESDIFTSVSINKGSVTEQANSS